MSDGEENRVQRLEEVELLRSIYSEEELTILAEPDDVFKVELRLLGDADPSASHISCTVLYKMHMNYPRDPPDIEYRRIMGVDEQELVQLLSSKTAEVMEFSQSLPMALTLFNDLQNVMFDNNKPMTSAYDITRVAIKEADLIQEQKVDNGSEESDAPPQGLQLKTLVHEDLRVTEEQFLKWTEEFEREMVDNGAWKLENAQKLTGKQFFMSKSGTVKDELAGGSSDLREIFNELDDKDLNDSLDLSLSDD